MWHKILSQDADNLTVHIPDDSDGILIDRPVKIGLLRIYGGKTQLAIRAPCEIDDLVLTGAGADGLLVQSSDVRISRCRVEEPRNLVPYDVRHPDAIQFVPPLEGDKVIKGCWIGELTIYAPEKPERGLRGIQGLTGFDCPVEGLQVDRFLIETDIEQHGISFTTPVGCKFQNGVIKPVRTSRKPGVVLKDRKGKGKGHGNVLKNIECRLLDVEGTEKIDVFVMKNKTGDALITEMAGYLRVEEAVIRAVIAIESGSRTDAILFERHIFARMLQQAGVDISETIRANPGSDEIIDFTPYGKGRGKDAYGTFKNQERRLSWARRIHDEAALMATSWGKFQIMGFNYGHCGFSSVHEFVEAMQDQDEQIRAFVNFIKDRQLDDELRDKDWAGFARAYNGPNFRKNDYDVKLSREYQRILAQQMPKKPVTKSRTMRGAGTTAVGGAAAGALVLTQVNDMIAQVKDLTGQLKETRADLGDITENVTAVTTSVSSMEWMIYGLGGLFLVTLTALGVVTYAYLQDRGFIQ